MVAIDFESSVVGIAFTGHQSVGERVTHVSVSAGERTDGRSDLGRFIDRSFAQCDRGRGRVFSGLGHGDREHLFGRQSTGIGAADANRIARLGVEVEFANRLDLVAIDFESSVVGIAFTGNQGVGERVTGVGVSAGERTNSRSDFGRFIDRSFAECDRGRGRVFSGLGHGDRERLFGRQSTGIGAADANGVAGLGVEVEFANRFDFIAIDFESSVVGIAFTGDQSVGERVTRVGVSAAKRTNSRSDLGRFIDRGFAQCDRGWGCVFSGFGDRDGQYFLDREATRVRAADANGVAGLGIEIECGSGLELVAIDCKGGVIGIAFALHEGVREGVTSVHIGAGERTDYRSDSGRLVDGIIRESHVGGRVFGATAVRNFRQVRGRQADDAAEDIARIEWAEPISTRHVTDQHRINCGEQAIRWCGAGGIRIDEAGIESHAHTGDQTRVFGVVAFVPIDITEVRHDLQAITCDRVHGSRIDIEVRDMNDL
ncbi:hypothetical protein CA85_31610 [Allorhodopirellula solitaria]|uniref:Uncharacterized protein n=1 Tax=Allorhodopirellula solitaria TaxID=2527987 RepID=A0A5C5XRJ1_9BACT|nr:hypothetical protein CA85_31610 [Allorhodopirellula solitaria]